MNSLRVRALLIATLVTVLSLAISFQSFEDETAAIRLREGTEVIATLASTSGGLNLAIKEVTAYLDQLAPLTESPDASTCQTALQASEPKKAVLGLIKQVFIVRGDTAICQVSPGTFSVFGPTGARLQWAVPSGAPLASGEPIYGAISREWVVVVAKHLPGSRGMIVASLSLSRLNELVFEKLVVSNRTLVTITDADGRTMLRSEGFSERVGRPIPLQSQVEGVSRSAFGFPVLKRPDGTLTVTQPEPVISPDAAGIMRMWAGRELSPMPWVMFAGRVLELPTLGSWIRRVVRENAATFGLLVLILWMLASVGLQLNSMGRYVATAAKTGNLLPTRGFPIEFDRLVAAFREAFDLRKAAELQLEASNQHLRQLVEAGVAKAYRAERFREAVMETAHDALLVVDAGGIIVATNSGVQQVLGFSRDELLGRRLADTVVPSEYRAAHQAAFVQRHASGHDLNGRHVELPVRRADGTTFPAELVVSTTHVGGQFFGVGLIRDITERAKSEQELRDAVTAAQVAARAKTEFLATMSHEIRTPLNGIMGMLDLLIDSPADATRSDRLKLARRSADTLLQLLNDILDFARLDAGRVELEPVDFDLNPLIEEIVDLIAESARQKGLLVSADVSGVALRCHADRARLRQILFNLAANAVKFTGQGRIDIRVAAVDSSGGHRVRLSVQDTGIGIAADRLPHIFSPFTQADSSMTRRYGGSGLGLSIVKALAERMDLQIGVSSEPGCGSTFWIELDALPRTALEEASVASAGSHPHSRPSRILIVEDDEASQLVAQEALSRAGHECDIAADGPTALTMAQDVAYDAVLMDCRLPGMDGFEVTRRLRAAGFSCPIIALTAQTSEGERLACIESGINAVVSKPVTPSRLVDAVASALDITSTPQS
ncbi:MAG: hypothetical protein RLZZ53_2845 [Acidobacteriota bacterium]